MIYQLLSHSAVKGQRLWQYSSPLLLCWGVSRWSISWLLKWDAVAVRSPALPGICKYIPGIRLGLGLATLKYIGRNLLVRETHRP